MTTLQQKALDLLNKSSLIDLASVNEEGYPRTCVVAKLANHDWNIYVATGASGNKVRQFQQNPKASVCYFFGGDSVTLLGTVQIIADKTEKAALWQDWLIRHFPKGVDDPEYCLLKFIPHEGTIYIGEEFATERIEPLTATLGD